jgi:transposase
LLREGIVYSGGQAWTGTHEAWLRRQRFDSPLTQAAFDEAYDAVASITARRDRLEQRITVLAADSEYTAVVRRLGCLRGISTLTALALAVEIGDWTRFSGNSIGAYVGLIPSETSSGQSRSQGPITKTGNSHVRRLLIEAAWHHRLRYVPGKTMHDRWDLATPAARARGDLGNRRLHHRWEQFQARKKRPTVANTAIARELAGLCWSLAILDT